MTTADETGRGTHRENLEQWLNYAFITAPVLLALIRVLVVARFDEQRLKVLLRTLDITAVVVSTIVPVLPLLAGFVVAVVLRELSDRPWWRRRFVVLVGAFLLLGAAVKLPMAYTFVLLVVLGVELWRLSGGVERTSVVKRRLGRLVMGLATLVAVAYVEFFGASRMWLPTEVVRTASGAETGFVLEAGDHDLTLMRRDGGRILIVRQDEVEKRTLCRLEENGWDAPRHPWRLVNDRSLYQLVTGDLESSGQLPTCGTTA
ncbi:hypothetical protein [Saccharothrix variisporea]|uniref:hypothetical protein n=1 Tax=Saccharothrix variisporea TaxID=543527 RepID=UPI0011C43B54|nr:hypothetical protein [Saccharothrix variisporea]